MTTNQWQGRSRPHPGTPFGPWHDIADIADHLEWWQQTARDHGELCQMRRTPEGISTDQLFRAMKLTGFISDPVAASNLGAFKRLCGLLGLVDDAIPAPLVTGAPSGEIE